MQRFIGREVAAATASADVPVTSVASATATHPTLLTAAAPGQGGALWASVATALDVSAKFVATKSNEMAAAAQPHLAAAGGVVAAKAGEAADAATNVTKDGAAVAGEYIASRASEVRIVTEAHVASAGDFITAKANETGEYIASRASEVKNTTQTHVATAGDYITTKTSETREYISRRTIEGLAVAGETITNKSEEAANMTRDSATAAGDYVSSKTVEAVSVTRDSVTAASGYVRTAAADQLEMARTAKMMLDEGGQDEEDRLMAKKASADAVALQETALASLAQAAQSLRDAEARLVFARSCAAEDAPAFDRLAPTYAERAAKIESFLASLEGGLEQPLITDTESIAMGILNTKLGYRSLWEPRQLPGGRSAGCC